MHIIPTESEVTTSKASATEASTSEASASEASASEETCLLFLDKGELVYAAGWETLEAVQNVPDEFTKVTYCSWLHNFRNDLSST